ncbi:cob(I)yrinic acid a,c-diamide adenosyltransferase [Patescibacteria group bacterium]|nr:cob(I)yrinic acid a,c-diamide adenosyltransferase [Patescibacteria group bacterium]
MPIYTRTGDTGTTSLFTGQRVSKTNLRIEACGSVDELSSVLGVVICETKDTDIKQLLTAIQKDLYYIMATLSGAKPKQNRLNDRVKFFEQKIDKLSLQLSPLNGFILPQGSKISALLHFARTVCRRSERAVIRQTQSRPSTLRSPSFLPVVPYLNRLSDLLFILARLGAKTNEITV